MFLAKAEAAKKERAKEDDDDDDSGSGGTMIIDAICAPSNIGYPCRTRRFSTRRENRRRRSSPHLYTPGEGTKPRTYREEAHKEYLKFAKCRKRSNVLVRKAIRKQFGYLARDLSHIDAMLAGGPPGVKLSARLDQGKTLLSIRI